MKLLITVTERDNECIETLLQITNTLADFSFRMAVNYWTPSKSMAQKDSRAVIVNEAKVIHIKRTSPEGVVIAIMSVCLKQYLVWLFCTTLTLAQESNHIPHSSGRTIATSGQLVSSVFLECFDGNEPFSRCVRLKVLEYFDNVSGEKRSLERTDDDHLDQTILTRVQRYLQTHQFVLRLPEFFQNAQLTYRPSRSLADFDIAFPEPDVEENRSLSTARDMMKQKMLLPLLMMLKLKLNAMVPVVLALVHLKATKALLLSKIAIGLVLGFLTFQLLMKKTAMNMMPMPMEVPATPMAYGPPTPAPSYGPPPSTISSYDAPIYEAPASWEPSAPSGPYARTGWESQSMAYNGYMPQQTNQPAPSNR